MNSRLYNRTLELINDRKRVQTFERISKDTGLTESWLSMFSRGKIEKPSVQSVETLYEYLTGTQLHVI